MCNLTLFLSAPYFLTAVSEFQIVRVWFALYPYQVLAHDELSRPLAASVPLIAGIEMFVYWFKGRSCDAQLSKGLLFKLNIDVGLENLDTFPLEVKMLKVILTLAPEIYLQIKKRKSYIRALFKQNRINPENLQYQCEQDRPKSKVHLGMLTFIFTLILFQQMVSLMYGSPVAHQYAVCVLVDLIFLGLPIYWVAATPEIILYLKHKYNQSKLRSGQF